MKYFIDTEFIEGFTSGKFNKKRHFIDLISIGIVCEDGRKYYAISDEFNPNDADKWVKDNVISKLEPKDSWQKLNGIESRIYKSNKQIAQYIVDFINPNIKDLIYTFTRRDCWLEQYYKKEFEYIKTHNTTIPDHYFKSGVKGDEYEKNRELIYNRPEFYAYYADYDWVVFCSLFGRMIDLPKGFPMYCKDLKQILDERQEKLTNINIKEQISYPKQKDEHNALKDAEWNFELYKHLQSIK